VPCEMGGGGGLCNITVVGNSFEGYLDRTINASDRDDQVCPGSSLELLI
jgi:hypothetical protein